MTSSEPEHGPERLPRLTSLRWGAAFAVFLFHLGNMETGWRPLYLFDAGYTGVTFFYILSGFVLVWSFRSDPSTTRFYRRRFARIYPATVIAGVATGVLLAAGWFGLHSTSGEYGTGALGAITSLFLVQAWFPGNYPAYSYDSVSWSLSCEAFFYLLFPFVVAAAATRRNRTVVGAVGTALALGVAATLLINPLGATGENIVYINPLIRLPEFLVGVALGIVVVRGWRPHVPLWLAVAVLVAGAAVPHHWFGLHYVGDYCVLPGFALLIASCVGTDLRSARGLLTSRTCIYLGEISFCFYLVHRVVMTALVSELGVRGHHYPLIGGLGPAVLILLVSLVAASALHHGVELPAQRLLRPSRPAAPGPSVSVATLVPEPGR